MERDTFLYNSRRKMQTLAHRFIADESMSKFYYWIVLKKKLNLENPQTFNEKLQWLKLYYFPNDPLVVQCADKYAVRSFMANQGYENKLVPLIGHWDNVNDIDWGRLPDQFVLKCNHGCAYNIVCSNKSTFNRAVAQNKLKRWMKEDFGAFNIELHYSKISPRIITCEEYLGESLTDYKFFCFNGTPKYLYVSNDLIHDRQAQIGFFYLDGTKMPFSRDDYEDISEISLPFFYDEMLQMASDLSRHFPFVRVDFFLANDTYYFAELTFTPGACMMPFNPPAIDIEWGKLLDISYLMKETGLCK